MSRGAGRALGRESRNDDEEPVRTPRRSDAGFRRASRAGERFVASQFALRTEGYASGTLFVLSSFEKAQSIQQLRAMTI